MAFYFSHVNGGLNNKNPTDDRPESNRGVPSPAGLQGCDRYKYSCMIAQSFEEIRFSRIQNGPESCSTFQII